MSSNLAFDQKKTLQAVYVYYEKASYRNIVNKETYNITFTCLNGSEFYIESDGKNLTIKYDTDKGQVKFTIHNCAKQAQAFLETGKNTMKYSDTGGSCKEETADHCPGSHYWASWTTTVRPIKDREYQARGTKLLNCLAQLFNDINNGDGSVHLKMKVKHCLDFLNNTIAPRPELNRNNLFHNNGTESTVDQTSQNKFKI